MKPATKSYFILLAIVVIYDLLFTLPPFLLHYGFSANLLYRFFQPVCHQMDSRSFHIFGYKLAVCSRCSAIYYGLTIGILVFPIFRSLKNVSMPGLIFIIVPVFLLIIDFSMNFLNLGQNTFVSRSVTGGLVGLSTAFFLVPVWISLFREVREVRKSSFQTGGETRSENEA